MQCNDSVQYITELGGGCPTNFGTPRGEFESNGSKMAQLEHNREDTHFLDPQLLGLFKVAVSSRDF